MNLARGGEYDSPTRRAQAEETRRQIADAARALFVDRGWSGTRVRDVAAAAGVSEPTVYAVYGSKAGLASALLDSLEGVADPRRLGQEVKAAAGDPGQLRAVVGFDRRLFEHGADAITVIREAGRTSRISPTSTSRDARAVRRCDATCSGPGRPRCGAKAPTSTRRSTSLALCNVDAYLVLTRERGWTPDQVEEWWADTLVELLLG